MENSKITTIPCVDASDFPNEVTDWCVENDISTHYQNDVVRVEDDGNPLAEWLKEQGYKFSDSEYGDFVAIIAT